MSQGSNPSQHQKRRPDWAALVIAIFLVIIACVIFGCSMQNPPAFA